MSQSQQRSVKVDPVPRLQLFNCVHADCGATFTRKWRLEEHETTHTGAVSSESVSPCPRVPVSPCPGVPVSRCPRVPVSPCPGVPRPLKCPVEGCACRFSRRSHLSRHALTHGDKLVRCSEASCTKTFYNKDKLKRHVRYAHGDKEHYFQAPPTGPLSQVYISVNFPQCTSPDCGRTFRKRRQLKLHQVTHGVSSGFRCTKAGCNATFRTHTARKAHEKTHTGYRCPHSQCPIVEHTWGKLLKHTAKHPASHTCSTCKKTFVKREALRRHKRTHALQKPVLLCPSEGCQAFFSTTFNLQHHIRKVHLKLLRHRCSFPGCDKAFAMRESLIRHLLHHDPDAAKPRASLFTSLHASTCTCLYTPLHASTCLYTPLHAFTRLYMYMPLHAFTRLYMSLHASTRLYTPLHMRQKRSSKSWQKRLEGRTRGSLVEDDLRRLFALRMRFSRRTKLETNLSGLFNERKIPHHVDPEVNLRDLFNIKPPQKVKG
ncbi:hypothetical protein QTP86_034848 [Hemibagrus guttatus]|nr:hypothetical protein QTP86_034848 [Hemibagrus guttatus]